MADQSFMKSLFHGVIAESVIFPYPEPSEGEADTSTRSSTACAGSSRANVDSAKIDASARDRRRRCSRG